MATRGFEGVTEADIAQRNARLQGHFYPTKGPKYRNRKVVDSDGVFDSKKEHAHWLELQARASCGEILSLRRQVAYPLYAWTGENHGLEIGRYIADFVWLDRDGNEHIEDVKSSITAKNALYRWKKSHFELQTGKRIEEV